MQPYSPCSCDLGAAVLTNSLHRTLLAESVRLSLENSLTFRSCGDRYAVCIWSMRLSCTVMCSTSMP